MENSKQEVKEQPAMTYSAWWTILSTLTNRFRRYLCGLTLVLMAFVLGVNIGNVVVITLSVLSLTAAYFSYSVPTGKPQSLCSLASTLFCVVAFTVYLVEVF